MAGLSQNELTISQNLLSTEYDQLTEIYETSITVVGYERDREAYKSIQNILRNNNNITIEKIRESNLDFGIYTKDNEIVVAFTGVNSFGDALSAAKVATSITPEQARLAVAVTGAAKQYALDADLDIWQAGHSLGVYNAIIGAAVHELGNYGDSALRNYGDSALIRELR